MDHPSLCSWSGGKDSCYALMRAMQQGYSPKVLLNVLNEDGKISRSHGIPSSILIAQAASAGLPLYAISSSWENYEEKFSAALVKLKSTFHLSHAIFGDIDLQAHRDWEEKVSAGAGLTAVLPLWKDDHKQLLIDMLQSGIETMIVSCNDKLGEEYLGKILTADLADEFERLGIDPCGENGEYHTLVLDCPLFADRIQTSVTGKVRHGDYWFAQLQ